MNLTEHDGPDGVDSVEIAGFQWVSKDGARGVLVVSESPKWLGDRMFRVRGTRGSGCERSLSYPGLLRKYKRVEQRPGETVG